MTYLWGLWDCLGSRTQAILKYVCVYTLYFCMYCMFNVYLFLLIVTLVCITHVLMRYTRYKGCLLLASVA